MKVLLINGSPNKSGCTFTALEEIANILEENSIDVERVHIGKEAIRGCIACKKCKTTGRCIFNDEANEIIDLITECDSLIIGAPVYYASPNGNLLSLLDRVFYAGSSQFAYKPGAAIVSARRGGTTAALEVLNKYITIAQMPLVSSQYWNMVHGNTPEEVQQDKEGMQTMRVLARNMAWLLKSIEAGKTAGVELPYREERTATNFVR